MRTLPIVIHLNAVHFVEDLNQWCHANGQTMKINRTERITTAAAFWHYYFYQRDEEDRDNGLIDYDYHFVSSILSITPEFGCLISITMSIHYFLYGLCCLMFLLVVIILFVCKVGIIDDDCSSFSRIRKYCFYEEDTMEESNPVWKNMYCFFFSQNLSLSIIKKP